jgi:hypothetical protein
MITDDLNFGLINQGDVKMIAATIEKEVIRISGSLHL